MCVWNDFYLNVGYLVWYYAMEWPNYAKIEFENGVNGNDNRLGAICLHFT